MPRTFTLSITHARTHTPFRRMLGTYSVYKGKQLAFKQTLTHDVVASSGSPYDLTTCCSATHGNTSPGLQPQHVKVHLHYPHMKMTGTGFNSCPPPTTHTQPQHPSATASAVTTRPQKSQVNNSKDSCHSGCALFSHRLVQTDNGMRAMSTRL